MAYEFRAEWELDMEKALGTFATRDDAARYAATIDGQDEYNGAEFILKENATGKEWFLTELRITRKGEVRCDWEECL